MREGGRCLWLVDYDKPTRLPQLIAMQWQFPPCSTQMIPLLDRIVLKGTGGHLETMSCRTAVGVKKLACEAVVVPQGVEDESGLQVLDRLLMLEGLEAYIINEETMRVQRLEVVEDKSERKT